MCEMSEDTAVFYFTENCLKRYFLCKSVVGWVEDEYNKWK